MLMLRHGARAASVDSPTSLQPVCRTEDYCLRLSCDAASTSLWPISTQDGIASPQSCRTCHHHSMLRQYVRLGQAASFMLSAMLIRDELADLRICHCAQARKGSTDCMIIWQSTDDHSDCLSYGAGVQTVCPWKDL